MKERIREGRPTSRYPEANEKHCGELEDHAPHSDGAYQCPGGPYGAPGNTRLK